MSFSARASNVWRAWSLRPCFIARTMLTWSFHPSQPQFTFSNPNHFVIDSDFFGAHTFRVQSGRQVVSKESWTSFDRVADHMSSSVHRGSDKLPEGQDVHVNWTGRGGNISASTYNA